MDVTLTRWSLFTDEELEDISAALFAGEVEGQITREAFNRLDAEVEAEKARRNKQKGN